MTPALEPVQAATSPAASASASSGLPSDLVAGIAHFNARVNALRAGIATGIIGNEELVTDVLVAILCQGHVLLEGVPGLGKTSLVRTLSQVLGVSFGRVQCTPDLMPADILGTHIVSDDGSGRRVMRFERGPVFANLLLVDEINRATPKTQAALLEVMQERQVTAGGERMVMPSPFFVLATQNPVEMEGTYPLPEAQLDRFAFKLIVKFPDADELVAIAQRTTGSSQVQPLTVMDGAELESLQEFATRPAVSAPLARYCAHLVLASHPDRPEAPPDVKRHVAYGASPRALQTLVRAARVHCLLAGRMAVSADDVRRVAKPTLRHRLIRTFEGEAAGAVPDRLIEAILATVAVA